MSNLHGSKFKLACTSWATIPGRVTTGSPSMILCTGWVTAVPSTPIGSTGWYVNELAVLWEAFGAAIVVTAWLELVNVRLTDETLFGKDQT